MSHLSIFWKPDVKLGISISLPCLSSWYKLPPALQSASMRFAADSTYNQYKAAPKRL